LKSDVKSSSDVGAIKLTSGGGGIGRGGGGGGGIVSLLVAGISLRMLT